MGKLNQEYYCKKCMDKDPDNFYDNYRSECKSCFRQRYKDRYKKIRQNEISRVAKYKKDHPDYVVKHWKKQVEKKQFIRLLYLHFVWLAENPDGPDWGEKRVIHGLSFREVARMTNLSAGTVVKRYEKGLIVHPKTLVVLNDFYNAL